MVKYLKKRKRFVPPKNLPIEDSVSLNMEKKNKIILSVILVILGLVFRLLPHPWNFMPISAIALFAGVYLGGFYALLLPLAAIFFSDIFLGFYDLKLMLAVYLSFVLVGLVGLGVRRHKNLATVILGSLTASVLFFLITNFAVWVFTPWYVKTLSGLIQCFIMAMPFFRNTLLGDLFYVTVFFGGYETVRFLVRKGLATLNRNNFIPQP